MSDKVPNQRSNSGNFSKTFQGERQGEENIIQYTYRRRLVEEAVALTLPDLRRNCGRAVLLRAADQGTPIPIILNGKHLEVYMTFDIHRMPCRQERWSDPSSKNVRLWLVCSICWHRARKLYIDLLQLSDSDPKLQCRKCGHFVYMSQHCGQRKWWRLSAKPIRRLLQQQNELRLKKPTPRVVEKLDELERMIWLYEQRAAIKSPQRTATGRKRKYKNVELASRLF
jgi:hypothetical protein